MESCHHDLMAPVTAAGKCSSVFEARTQTPGQAVLRFVLGILLLTQDESEVQMQVSWEARRCLGTGLGVLVSSPKLQAIGQEKIASCCTREVLGWILENFLCPKGCQALVPSAQGSDWVPIPEEISKPCGCGACGQVLVVAVVVLGQLLHSMGPEVFSNLSDSKILWFYVPHSSPHL